MRKVLFLLAYLFIFSPLVAQPTEPGSLAASRGQYPFVHYTPKDGLINSRVRKAFQDSRGKLYFLTYSGLSVYDGARFRNYTTQSGLVHDLVNDIIEITPDSFLVATNSCGLNALVNGKIRKLDVGDICFINRFLRDRDGIIYATTDYGLYRLDKNHFEKLSTYWPDQVMYLGDIAAWGDYLVFTTNDLRGNTGLFLYSKKENRITDVLPDEYITDIKTGPDGHVWLSTSTKTCNLDTTALAMGKLSLRKPYASFLQDDDLPSGGILFNRQNDLLIFNSTTGCILYRRDGSRLNIPSPEPTAAIVQSFFDQEDILWICYDGNGVFKLANTKLQAVELFGKLNSSGIKSVTPFNADSTWFVMYDGHWILRSGLRNKMFTVKSLSDGYPLRTTRTHFYAIHDIDLFMAPIPAGNNTVLEFKKIFTLPDSSAFGGRTAEDPFGNIILHERYAICVFNHDKRIFSFPLDSYDLVEGLYISRNKKCWMVTRGTGFHVFSLHPENPAQYMQEESHFFKELEGASPRCIVIDKDERLWVGTRSNGLMCFELHGNRLEKKIHLRINNGLTDNFVTSLACDGDNNIIIGTQTGLDKLIRIPNGFRIENVTKSNNIFSFITHVWTDTKNNAFGLTNAKSVLQVSPDRAEQAIPEPSLLIEDVKLNGETVAPGILAPRWKYYQRNISFAIAAPTFIDEKQVQYSYRLSGSGNDEWSEPGTNADISLLNLSPGRYTLEVKAFFPSTSYASRQLAYSFEILPPWWQTLWFRIPAALLLLTIAMFVIRSYYRRKLEREKSILEKQQAIEKERTRIATDMHDDLGAGLSRIKFLSETIGIKKQLQQPIEEDISSIRQYSHEMIDKMGEIVWALNEKNDSLSDLLAYTRSYAVEYLSQNGIHCTVNTPDLFPATFVSGEYRRNIYLAVKEALHNIVKHAQATEVVISIGIDTWLSIFLTDNGVGFAKGPLRPYSNGLSNMKKRMEDIGGRLEIRHENGTTIALFSPIP